MSGVPRRRLLAGAGLVVAGAGAGVLATPSGAGAITPNEALMTEHGVLKRVLLAYSAAVDATDEPATWAAARTCALVVRDYVESFHEGLEEGYVFPELLAAGREAEVVRTLLDQRAAGRRLTTAVLQATDPDGPATEAGTVRSWLSSFVRMYERHEAWEDTVVYPAHRELLGDRRSAELGERLAELERRRLGRRSLADVLDRLAPAERQLGTSDLGAVTPVP